MCVWLRLSDPRTQNNIEINIIYPAIYFNVTIGPKVVPKLRAAELAITMMTTTTMVMLMTRIMTSINSQHATHHWWQGSWPNMKPTWSRQDPGGSMLAPWTLLSGIIGLTRQPMWVSRMFHVAGVLRQPMPYTRNANIIEPNVWSPKAYVWPLD